MDSDSDRTVDSDELEELISQSQRKEKVNVSEASNFSTKNSQPQSRSKALSSTVSGEYILKTKKKSIKKNYVSETSNSKPATPKTKPVSRSKVLSDSDSDQEIFKKKQIIISKKHSSDASSSKVTSKERHPQPRSKQLSDSDSNEEVVVKKKQLKTKKNVINKDSDSDRTIDSDEFEKFCAYSQKEEKCSPKGSKISVTKMPAHTNLNEISESDSEDELETKKLNSNISNRKREKCKFGKDCFRKNPDHLKNFYHGDDIEDSEHEEVNPVASNKRPKCQYGQNCYRKNEYHRKTYHHEDELDRVDEKQSQLISQVEEKPSHSKTKLSTSLGCKNYQFYLTKVSGIPEKYNCLARDIKDILSYNDGTLISSAQFNYMFDISWLIQQYPQKYRNCPLTIVHGEQRESKKALEKSGASFPNIKFCQAKLDIPFGTHHTKMMFLLYKEGFKIVIHTSNIVDSDWFQRTQGMWVSPLLPELQNPSSTEGESPTNFKRDLLEYIAAYGAPGLEEWSQIIKRHDFSKVRVVLIGSVPGRHIGTKKTSFGHLKLRKVLNLHGSSKDTLQSDWPVICQFSSIGSLGASPNQWMTSEFGTSLSTVESSPLNYRTAHLKLVFPTVENVRKSLQGYPAGASLPYSIKVAQKQPYLKGYMHQWKSEKLGRSEASPHIKTYLRVSPDNSKIAWFLLTSANLSKAAWGALEKKGTQFMIRSYELGVLFLPKFFDIDIFSTPASVKNDFSKMFPVPYDIPLEPYLKNDEPWIWDIPHIRAPDRFGQMWCPP